jgi:DNA ligase 1
MKRFAHLFLKLEQSNKTRDKLEALKQYFLAAPDQDRLWTLAMFTHKRPKRQVNSRFLRQWCCEVVDIQDWLFEESYQTVGDLAETIALLLPLNISQQDESLDYWLNFLINLKDLSEDEKKEKLLWAWSVLDKDEIFIFIKLITGNFRVGVSQNLITQAIADTFNLEKTEVAHRIMGDWDPKKITFDNLLLQYDDGDNSSRPYPFLLAHPLEKEPEELGNPSEWQVEWKWDGIRGQLIHRAGDVFVWSRGEELVTEKFPELAEIAAKLPEGTVLDGEILAFLDGQILPFGTLQTRISRKNLSKKILQEAPVGFKAYDLMEYEGNDLRSLPLFHRRVLLEDIISKIPDKRIVISDLVEFSDWKQLQTIHSDARSMKAEGFMLKRKDAAYEVGRKRGIWWKWKTEPLTIDGVMVYAQKGHGRRADLYTDFTLAVWDGDQLVPFAKAYSGLTDAEMVQVDRFVKQNTKEKFGPVRTVKPGLVFEIAFEGIQKSSRHKSGIALRFPRIHRWRVDKSIHEANTLSDLKALLDIYGG